MYAKINSQLVFFIIIVFSSQAFAAEYNGNVIGIADGDTITILTSENRQLKIRLSEIDTPESKQPYGNKAKQQLAKLVFNKQVVVEKEDIDRYKRIVGKVFVDGIDINAKMVELGAAWVYRKYAKNNHLYVLEDKARKNKIGLWSLPESEQIPPWEWRKKKILHN